VFGVLGQAEFAQDGDALAGEGLVELDDVEIGNLQAEAGAELLRSPARGRCP
jgi:hypothetical protein